MSNTHRPESRSVTAKLPTLAEARRRLADAKDRHRPWLTPAGIEAARGAVEVHGPKAYRKRRFPD